MGGRKGLHILNSKYGTSFDSKQWLSLDPCGLAGISCSFSTHIFALIVVYEYLLSGSLSAQIIFCFFYLPASLLALTSLFKAWTTDPGAVPMGVRPLVTVKRASGNNINNNDNNDNSSSANSNKKKTKKRERGLRRCHKCNDNFKPNRAHHDSVTGRCIVKMDHFCPWVGNAIGGLNHKFFILFIFYTMCTTLISLLLLLIRAFFCVHHNNKDDSHSNSTNNDITVAPKAVLATADSFHRTLVRAARSASDEIERNAHEIMKKSATDVIENDQDIYLLEDTLILESNMKQIAQHDELLPTCDDLYNNKALMLLLMISFLFFVFTSCMLYEQIEAIKTNTGKIARMKMRLSSNGSAEYAPVTEEFNEMFGGSTPHVTWHWFLPISISFPRSMKKVILGYDWDESMDSSRPFEERSTLGNSSDHRNLDNNSAGDTASESLSSSTNSSNNDADNNDGMESILLDSDSGSSSDIENGRQRIKKRSSNSRNLSEIV